MDGSMIMINIIYMMIFYAHSVGFQCVNTSCSIHTKNDQLNQSENNLAHPQYSAKITSILDEFNGRSQTNKQHETRNTKIKHTQIRIRTSTMPLQKCTSRTCISCINVSDNEVNISRIVITTININAIWMARVWLCGLNVSFGHYNCGYSLLALCCCCCYCCLESIFVAFFFLFTSWIVTDIERRISGNKRDNTQRARSHTTVLTKVHKVRYGNG